MAQVFPMAALSYLRSSQFPPSPLSACSSSAVLCAVRIRPNRDKACSNSSHPFPMTFFSGLGRKSGGAGGGSACLVEDYAHHLSFCPKPCLTYLRFASCSLWFEWESNGCAVRRRTMADSAFCTGKGCFASCTGKGGGGELGVKQVEQDLEDKGDVSTLDVEAEIYDFMEKSAKPNSFPTKSELIDSGRMDLVEAIVLHGGWLAYGWDMDDEGAANADDVAKHLVDDEESSAGVLDSPIQETDLVNLKDEECSAGSLDVNILQKRKFSHSNGSASSSSMATYSGKSLERESGIEGILKRLEKERSSIFLVGPKNKTVNGMAKGNKSIPLDSRNQFFPDFDGGEIFLGNINEVENFNNTSIDDCAYTMDHGANEERNGRKKASQIAHSDQDQIYSRLQQLEAELSSVLGSFNSTSDAILSLKNQEGSLGELHGLSDAWELQETKIMNAHHKLRATKAKLAVLEGKMALEIIEAKKIIDEKQKKIDASRRASSLLRTAYVVWSNSASEVLLSGSFDGWSSQRKMERSSMGIFSLHLKLYPGRYEIKFIVDGIWKIDPLRPIVCNDGFENNLLIVS